MPLGNPVRLSAGLGACLFAAVMAAAQVTEVPVLQPSVGGRGGIVGASLGTQSEGSSLQAPLTQASLSPVSNLPGTPEPTLPPSVIAPRPGGSIAAASADPTAVQTPKALKKAAIKTGPQAGPAAPAVEDAAFRKGLQGVSDGTRKIETSAAEDEGDPGADEKLLGPGAGIFDGTQGGAVLEGAVRFPFAGKDGGIQQPTGQGSRSVVAGETSGRSARLTPTAGAVAADIVLSPHFAGNLKRVEELLPAEVRESPRNISLRQELEAGLRLLKDARARIRAEVKAENPGLAEYRVTALAQERLGRDLAAQKAARTVQDAGGALLARYAAALPPGEKLDFGSADGFSASLDWSARLRRIGAGQAFPFRFGPAARKAAAAIREAVLAEAPQLSKTEFAGVARVIGVLVMKDGTVYFAFSGLPETLRVVLGGKEAAILARLNPGGRGVYRLVPLETGPPEGLETLPDPAHASADNKYCAEKKLLSVLRENPSRIEQVAEWAMLWRGDPKQNGFGSRHFPDYMAPCPHCVHNARVMLGARRSGVRER